MTDRTRATLLPLAILTLAASVQANEKPAATWTPAAKSHQRSGRSTSIDRIVIHTIEGSASSAVNTFRTDPRKVSAHYIVGKDGALLQCVLDGNTAYHCGQWNSRSIGIEHEGWADRAGTWTDAIMRSSARLTRWLCDTYRIPIDRSHIVGHVEVPGASHGDPGRHFDWDRYLRLVRGAAPSGMPPAAAGDPEVTASSSSSPTASADHGSSSLPASSSSPSSSLASLPRGSSGSGSGSGSGSAPTGSGSGSSGSGSGSGSSGSRRGRSRAPAQEGADAVKAGEDAVRAGEESVLDPKTRAALAALDAALARPGLPSSDTASVASATKPTPGPAQATSTAATAAAPETTTGAASEGLSSALDGLCGPVRGSGAATPTPATPARR